MKVLVAGGAGFIGSHTAVELAASGLEPVVADNYCNSDPGVAPKLAEITGKNIPFFEIDLCCRDAVRELFRGGEFDAVIHFAGHKAVGESVAKPLKYYRNNLLTTLNILDSMAEFGGKNLVFSSSATVYGDPASVPMREDFPLSATNPYGRTKLMIEDMLRDVCRADPTINVALLRYFNPIGAHRSGLIGETFNDESKNLMPNICRVAAGQLEHLSVCGSDYPTPDGTGIRDYIHVADLASGHVAALKKLGTNCGLITCNLGTGRGYSVLEIVRAFEQASGRSIPIEFTPRRPGDIAVSYADPSLALELLGWKAEHGLSDMCRDTAHWMRRQGYFD